MSRLKEYKLEELEFKERFTYLKSIPFTEKDLRRKGSKFQIVIFKPKTRIKPHYHKKTCEIFYILRGSGILKLNEKEFKCSKDRFFLCEPEDVHEFINESEEELVILIFKTNEEKNDIYFLEK